MCESSDEVRLVAEHAAHWVERLKQPVTGDERKEFVRWLRRSSLHVREMLLAATWDRVLDDLDPGCRIDLDALIGNANFKIVPARPDATLSRPLSRRFRWVRWPWVSGMTATTTAALLVSGWTGVATLF